LLVGFPQSQAKAPESGKLWGFFHLRAARNSLKKEQAGMQRGLLQGLGLFRSCQEYQDKEHKQKSHNDNRQE
jgi:hypothetical protein